MEPKVIKDGQVIMNRRLPLVLLNSSPKSKHQHHQADNKHSKRDQAAKRVPPQNTKAKKFMSEKSADSKNLSYVDSQEGLSNRKNKPRKSEIVDSRQILLPKIKSSSEILPTPANFTSMSKPYSTQMLHQHHSSPMNKSKKASKSPTRSPLIPPRASSVVEKTREQAKFMQKYQLRNQY